MVKTDLPKYKLETSHVPCACDLCKSFHRKLERQEWVEEDTKNGL